MESEPAPESLPVEPDPTPAPGNFPSAVDLDALPFRAAQRYYRTEETAPVVETSDAWNPVVGVTIALAALLAHGLCMRAIFYHDDWPQIVANDWVDHGYWWDAYLRTLTYFTYWLTYVLFGISAPAFHLGNLLLHAGTAVLVGGFARNFLTQAADMPTERARRIGWWSGLLFAVHPLCSETLNYTHSRDIELVTLFAVVAASCALRWRRRRKLGYTWPVLMLLALTAATFCKEVGFIVAGGAVALVYLGTTRLPNASTRQAVAMPLPGTPKMPKTKLVVAPKEASLGLGNWPITLSLALVAVSLAAFAWPAWRTAVESLKHPRLGWHALTKMRVFWLYMQRVVWPAGLCSDHQITWTHALNDPGAWVSTAGVAALLVLTVFLWWRGGRARAVGTMLALTLWFLLHRLANPGEEPMVESRMYPVMWPLCVLLAWGIGAFEGRRQKAEDRRGSILVAEWVVVLSLVAGCAVLSERRAQTWGSLDTLVADVMAQYPFQAQALESLQDRDVRADYWVETGKAQVPIRDALNNALAYNAHSSERGYDPDALLIVHVRSEGTYALALAELGRRKEALAHLDWLGRSLKQGRQPPREFQAEYLYAVGRVMAAVGQKDAAINYLVGSYQMGKGSEAERELRKVEAAK